MKLKFSRQIFGKHSNIARIPPVGADWFHADRRRYGRMDGQAGRQAKVPTWRS